MNPTRMRGAMPNRLDLYKTQAAYCARMAARASEHDDETCRLEPLQNPFGPKVLPMSPV
jgi:hypothetical protein